MRTEVAKKKSNRIKPALKAEVAQSLARSSFKIVLRYGGMPVFGETPMKPKKKTLRMVRRPRHADRRVQLQPIGLIRSTIKQRSEAPKQGSEGAPDAWLELNPLVAQGIDGLTVGDDIIIVTWLHRARRDVLKVHPRSDRTRPLTGVFATRSPDRPNPLGLHPVTVREVDKNRLRIGPIEAIDGTPVVDIKPVHAA
jgi:tRNA-Thr(GGU) m(6)t(6)A37 methyltransferase TsaA